MRSGGPYLPDDVAFSASGVFLASLLGSHDGRFLSLLAGSHLKLTGESIAPEGYGTIANMMDWLYRNAPFGLLAQDASAEPRFVHANQAAQSFFECNWHEIVGMHSRLSAPEMNREARETVMEDVLKNGYRAGYRGVRRTLQGRLFWIEDVSIWNIVDDDVIHGQAALIRQTSPYFS
ncbi:MEKHLA domain-containing protein [Streptomyces sp. NPDC003328]|uniref:MEKHLA domain-containing protein n=1 Tax=Streptomyces lannensis TaxID=766498 RepID=A0ABP7L253_9ACTN